MTRNDHSPSELNRLETKPADHGVCVCDCVVTKGRIVKGHLCVRCQQNALEGPRTTITAKSSRNDNHVSLIHRAMTHNTNPV